jgi:uncharacterized membrane protein
MNKWISALIVLLFITDAIILLDIPFLREVASFIYFTTVPGILILHILKLNRMEFLKKVALSIGLSISFIIFAGLLLNSLYPLLLKPLSLAPVLILFNVLLIIMALAAYWRNREEFKLKDFFDLNINLKGKLTSMLLFPIIFPFMAIIGTYLMNNTQNNIILLFMLFLIPIYLILVLILKERIHSSTYPIAIWAIATSLLLMHGLTSFHIIGRDVNIEFYCYNLALNGFHWDILEYYNPYNVCLSITILPVVYKTLTNFNSEYIFKLFFGLIGALIPLVLYQLSKKYVGNQGALFVSLLFVFQTYFIYILGMVRQEIAFLFFFLAVIVFFDSRMDRISNRILFIVLIVSVIVSHYATAYITIFLIYPILFLPFLKSLKKYIINNKPENKLNFKNFDIISTISVFLALWYYTAAKVQFEASSFVTGTTLNAAGTIGLNSTIKDASVTSIFGIGLKSLPNTLSVIINDLIFLIIAIGLFYLVWKYLKSRKELYSQFENGYLVGILISIILLVLFVVLPYLSVAYGAQRLFLQILIFLGPVFVIGGFKVAKLIKRPKLAPWILIVLLIALFTSGTYLQYHFDKMPYSPYYEKEGAIRDEHFIYTQEVIAASWLKYNGIKEMGIQGDGIAYSRLLLAYNGEIPNLNNTDNTYLYLGYVNLHKNILYGPSETVLNITDYNKLIGNRYRIYDNGGSEIFITNN